MVSQPILFEGFSLRRSFSGSLLRLYGRLLVPIDGASLAIFRIMLGAMLLWESTASNILFAPTVSDFFFRYTYFEWLPAFPALNVWFRAILFILSLLLIFGIQAQLAAFASAILVAYGFLLVSEYYLNHIYLFWIYLFLMAFVPSHRDFSLRMPFGLNPRPPPVRRIHLLLLTLQTEIVLIYAGLVKINSDWLALVPLRHWLLANRDRLYYGGLLDYDWIIGAANYGVIALHLVGAPLLLIKKTRLPVFILYFVFHATNSHTFNIEIFPWLTIASTLLFFEPNWPRSLLRWCGLTRSNSTLHSAQPALAAAPIIAAFCAGWLILQVIIPLRHYLYPGNVAWTGEGNLFSWRMKLVDLRVVSFWGIVFLPNSNAVVIIDLANPLGVFFQRVAARPELTLQLAHQVAKAFGAPTEDVRVHVYDMVSWNFRPPKLLIDPLVDLTKKHNSAFPADWVLRENDGIPTRYEDITRDRHSVFPADLAKVAGYPDYSDCREFRPPNQQPLIMCRKPAQR